jgi:hypothetical protein
MYIAHFTIAPIFLQTHYCPSFSSKQGTALEDLDKQMGQYRVRWDSSADSSDGNDREHRLDKPLWELPLL